MGDDRPRNPSGSLPAVGRTPTPHELAYELKKLREAIGGRLERVEQFADDEVLGFIKKAGARYDEVAERLTRLSTQFEEATKTMADWRADVRAQLQEHDGRIFDVEDRSSRHQVRLDTLDDLRLDERVRSLEQHAAGDQRELSLTRTQQRRLDARTGVISTIVGALAALLSHLL